MTNLEQRAEEILRSVGAHDEQCDSGWGQCSCVETILAALRQTREEALKEAAKVVENNVIEDEEDENDHWITLAAKIRARASESEEGK